MSKQRSQGQELANAMVGCGMVVSIIILVIGVVIWLVIMGAVWLFQQVWFWIVVLALFWTLILAIVIGASRKK